MPIRDFVETDEQYHNGVGLEEYNGKISLVRAYMSKDGEAKAKWGYPEKNKEPISRSIPWKVELGDRDEAVSILNRFLIELDAGNDPVNAPTNDGSDIPF